MSNIVINTPNLYAEIQPTYKSLAVTLVPVSKFDIRQIEEQVKAIRTKKTILSYFRSSDRGLRSRPWRGEDDNVDNVLDSHVMYEVRIIWEYVEGQDNHRESVVSTHGMSLEEAKKEKLEITNQLAERCTTVRMVERYLQDPTEIAIGLLGNDYERHVARTVHKFLNKTKGS